MNKVLEFVKRETVLCVALGLGFLSMFLVFPDKKYAEYIDFRTLSLLFCLMSVMAGVQKIGLFEKVAGNLLKSVRSLRIVILILVLLCFFFSMLITNDVALITFIPFTFIVLKLLGTEELDRLVVPIVIMQTIAANLGSMLTPIGNPQNLYLFTKSGASFVTFVGWMAPYTLVSFAILLGWCLSQGNIALRKNSENAVLNIKIKKEISLKGKELKLAAYMLLFFLSLLTVAGLIEYHTTMIITISAILLLDKEIFRKVDYSLLLTFVGFFVFIGNVGRIPGFANVLKQIVSGNEVFAAVVASQVMSNVPAALLLSGFTENLKALTIGVDLGGLGTLIASMASLISYKYVAKEFPEKRSRYLGLFTVINIAFLAALLFVYIIIE